MKCEVQGVLYPPLPFSLFTLLVQCKAKYGLITHTLSKTYRKEKDQCYAYGRPCAYVTKFCAYGRPLCTRPAVCIDTPMLCTRSAVVHTAGRSAHGTRSAVVHTAGRLHNGVHTASRCAHGRPYAQTHRCYAYSRLLCTQLY